MSQQQQVPLMMSPGAVQAAPVPAPAPGQPPIIGQAPQGQAQAQVVGTTQIVFIQAPAPAPAYIKVYENYAAKTSRFLGIGRVTIGISAILTQFILSGSFGIAAQK